jgi:hypothetical protein
MKKEDLTIYNDEELSLRVFNDEGLYRMRKNSQLIGLLNDLFIFTEDQLEILEQDLKDDLESED